MVLTHGWVARVVIPEVFLKVRQNSVIPVTYRVAAQRHQLSQHSIFQPIKLVKPAINQQVGSQLILYIIIRYMVPAQLVTMV